MIHFIQVGKNAFKDLILLVHSYFNIIFTDVMFFCIDNLLIKVRFVILQSSNTLF